MASELISIVENVAPHGGAWIEILVQVVNSRGIIVAPHGGAWIEMRR